MRESSEHLQQHVLLNNFLTQRAVQTVVFLQRTNRDEVTANWLGRFLGHEGMELFHGATRALKVASETRRTVGTRGLKVAWDEYVSALLTADTEEIVVSLRKRGGRGLSPGNPYAPAEQWWNYTVDIFPRDLGERVLLVRSTLAQEWLTDLGTIEASQDEFLRAYRDSRRNGTDPGAGLTLLGALEGYDPAIGAGDSSPYRGGNYDLCLRLSAHQAILRTLEAHDTTTKQARYAKQFLADFFQAHGRAFDGDGPYGVSRAFFAKLMAEPPRMKLDGDATLLLDPTAIAEQLLREQRKIVDIWRDDVLPHVDQANAEARRAALEASFS